MKIIGRAVDALMRDAGATLRIGLLLYTVTMLADWIILQAEAGNLGAGAIMLGAIAWLGAYFWIYAGWFRFTVLGETPGAVVPPFPRGVIWANIKVSVIALFFALVLIVPLSFVIPGGAVFTGFVTTLLGMTVLWYVLLRMGAAMVAAAVVALLNAVLPIPRMLEAPGALILAWEYLLGFAAVMLSVAAVGVLYPRAIDDPGRHA